MTHHIELTPQQNQRFSALLSSGKYPSATDLMDNFLTLAEQQRFNDWLRREAQVGIDAIARGEYVEFDNAEDLDRHLYAIAERAIYPEGRP